MKKIICLFGMLVFTQMLDALQVRQYWDFQKKEGAAFSAGFDESTDLIRGYLALKGNYLTMQRHYGNVKFDKGVLGLASLEDKSDDPMTQLLIFTYPSIGVRNLNPTGAGSIGNLCGDRKKLMCVISGMLKLANDVRECIKTGHTNNPNLEAIINGGELSDEQEETLLRYVGFFDKEEYLSLLKDVQKFVEGDEFAKKIKKDETLSKLKIEDIFSSQGESKQFYERYQNRNQLNQFELFSMLTEVRRSIRGLSDQEKEQLEAGASDVIAILDATLQEKEWSLRGLGREYLNLITETEKCVEETIGRCLYSASSSNDEMKFANKFRIVNDLNRDIQAGRNIEGKLDEVKLFNFIKEIVTRIDMFDGADKEKWQDSESAQKINKKLKETLAAGVWKPEENFKKEYLGLLDQIEQAVRNILGKELPDIYTFLRGKDKFVQKFRRMDLYDKTALHDLIVETYTRLDELNNEVKVAWLSSTTGLDLQKRLREMSILGQWNKNGYERGKKGKKGDSSREIFVRNSLITLLRTVIGAVKRENIGEDENKWKDYPYRSGYANDIICAYAWSICGTNDLGILADCLSIKKTTGHYESKKTEDIQKNLPTSCIPFEAGVDIIGHGNGYYFKRKLANGREVAVRFADCVETTLRQICSLLFFSVKADNNLGVEFNRIPEKSELREFFGRRNIFESANGGDDQIRLEWGNICSGHKRIEYSQSVDGVEMCELNGGKGVNLIKLLCLLMKDYDVKKDREALDDPVARKRKMDAQNFIQKVNAGGDIGDVCSAFTTIFGIRSDVEMVAEYSKVDDSFIEIDLQAESSDWEANGVHLLLTTHHTDMKHLYKMESSQVGNAETLGYKPMFDYYNKGDLRAPLTNNVESLNVGVLKYLLRNPEWIFSKDDLLNEKISDMAASFLPYSDVYLLNDSIYMLESLEQNASEEEKDRIKTAIEKLRDGAKKGFINSFGRRLELNRRIQNGYYYYYRKLSNNVEQVISFFNFGNDVLLPAISKFAEFLSNNPSYRISKYDDSGDRDEIIDTFVGMLDHIDYAKLSSEERLSLMNNIEQISEGERIISTYDTSNLYKEGKIYKEKVEFIVPLCGYLVDEEIEKYLISNYPEDKKMVFPILSSTSDKEYKKNFLKKHIFSVEEYAYLGGGSSDIKEDPLVVDKLLENYDKFSLHQVVNLAANLSDKGKVSAILSRIPEEEFFAKTEYENLRHLIRKGKALELLRIYDKSDKDVPIIIFNCLSNESRAKSNKDAMIFILTNPKMRKIAHSHKIWKRFGGAVRRP